MNNQKKVQRKNKSQKVNGYLLFCLNINKIEVHEGKVIEIIDDG
jgi:hypothetical protein